MPSLRHNDTIVTECSEKADLLNKYFTKQTMLEEENAQIPFVPSSSHKMQRFNISPDEVKDIINCLIVEIFNLFSSHN